MTSVCTSFKKVGYLGPTYGSSLRCRVIALGLCDLGFCKILGS